MSERVTIKDIADKAGVSVSTVSRIINGKGSYPPETKKKVKDVINELNYRPSFLARTFREKSSPIIGIVVSNLKSESFSMITDRLVEQFVNYGYYPFVCVTYNDEQIEEGYGHVLSSLNASGIIYIMKDSQVCEECRNIPTVFIGSDPDASNEGVRVTFDIIGGAKSATEELIKAGCKKILYVETDRQRKQNIGRYLGYQQALWENGLSPDEKLVLKVNVRDEQAIISEMDKFMKKGIAFDAIFANTVSTAINMIEYLKNRNIRVPEDVKLIAFEGGKMADYYRPRISAIEMDPIRTSQAAFDSMCELIKNRECTEQVVRIPSIYHCGETINGNGAL